MERTEQRNGSRGARWPALFAVSLAALAPRGARGELPPVVRRVPAVVIEAEAPEALPGDPTSFTTVLHADDFRGEAANVAELLSRSVGVQVRSFGGPGDPAEVSIRGSTARQVAIALDGVRLDTAQSGAVDLSTIPLALLDRIEISRGGGAVQAGSGAMGGVVNLVTLQPGGPPRRRVVGSAGSFDSYELSGAASGAARGLDYVLGYDAARTDGDFPFERPERCTRGGCVPAQPDEAERINNHSQSHAALFGLGRALGEQGYLSLRASPYYVSRGVPGPDADGIDARQRRNAHERRFRNLGVLSYERADLAGAGVDANLQVSHLWERASFRDPDPVPLRAGTLASDDRNGRLNARANLEGGGELGFLEHRLTTALEYQRDSLRSDDFADRNRDTRSALLQWDLGFFERRARVVPAVRFEDVDGFGAEWLPRIGAVLEPWPGVRVRGDLERSYRVPAFDELYFPDKGFIRGNPSLAPEESTDGDVGVELGLPRLGWLRRLRFASAWFERDVDDSIVFVTIGPGQVAPRNTGPATIQGVELAGSLGFGDWLDVEANHTWLDARRDLTDVPLPGRPDRETSVRVALGPPSRVVRLVAEMHHASEIPANLAGSLWLPERTTWDATLGFDLKQLPVLAPRLPVHALLVSVEGRNLTDELVRDAEFFPQPGRSVMVRMETEW